MNVISTVKEIRSLLKKPGISHVGLVPTMGTLHEGHLSLVRNAINECPVIVVSIYVNPTQFNDKEDLKNYPRNVDADLRMLSSILRDADIVFTPADSEMYPVEDKRVFHFGNLEKVMEALHRPGHFNGVAQAVSRLFDIVEPDMAWFGRKDFQQVAVIKELVRQNSYKTRIIVSPIIREPDGLAMSSRNRLLEPELRKKVPVIFKSLSEASKMAATYDIPEIKKYVKETIENTGNLFVEYFEIADDRKLFTLKSRSEIKKSRNYYGCIAVRAGKIRLIDNIAFPLQ